MKPHLDFERPKFSLALLHPKYWGIWLGFLSLALIVNIMPYSLLLAIGRSFGKMAMRFGKGRVHTARRNLELAFPTMTPEEIDAFVLENFKNTGAGLAETGIAWFWPTWRFKRLIIHNDMQPLNQYEQEGRGVLLCCVHALNLEVTARAFGIVGMPGCGVFRPHTNPAYNWIQYWGRSHNGNTLVDRKDLKKMIRVLREGQRLFYLPDHDYGRKKAEYVPFFAVEDACTTTGTSILAKMSKCAIVMGSGFRNQQGRYEVIADKDVTESFPLDDQKAAAALMNQHVEEVILRAPEQWMWLHRRFKHEPDPSAKGARRYK